MKKKHYIQTVNDIIRHYNKNTYGHWFSRDTMRFFKTKLSSWVGYNSDKDLFFFISSEKFRDNDERRYTIRYYNPTSFDIGSYSEFLEYDSLSSAKKAAEKLVNS